MHDASEPEVVIREISTAYVCRTCNSIVTGARVSASTDVVVWGACRCHGWRADQKDYTLVAALAAAGLECWPALEPDNDASVTLQPSPQEKRE
jgi:hypothetical protein